MNSGDVRVEYEGLPRGGAVLKDTISWVGASTLVCALLLMKESTKLGIEVYMP